MSAQVTTVPVSVLYCARCEECCAEFSSKSSMLANNWAALHDELNHVEPITRRDA